MTRIDRLGQDVYASLEDCLACVDDSSLPIKDRVEAANQLRRQGFVAEAWAALDRINEPAQSNWLRKLIERIVAGEELRRAVTHDLQARKSGSRFPSPDICIHIQRFDNAIGTVITFGGVGRLFTRVEELQDKNYNLIELRDPLSRFYISQVPGLGISYYQSSRNLAQILTALESKKTYMIGFSLGGYAALLYGLDLSAHAVLVLNGTPSLDLASLPGDRIQDHPILRKMDALSKKHAIDLVPKYRTSPNAPAVTMVYGAEHKRDATLARLMEGVSNCRFVTIPAFDGHQCYGELRHRGQAAAIIAIFLDS